MVTIFNKNENQHTKEALEVLMVSDFVYEIDIDKGTFRVIKDRVVCGKPSTETNSIEDFNWVLAEAVMSADKTTKRK